MISESQQEQAALYALGLLDADEATEFEHALSEIPELGVLARELQDAAAALVRAVDDPTVSPSASTRAQVLARIASETDQSGDAQADGVILPPRAEEQKILRPSFGWVPWAMAALLLGCVSLLAWDRMGMVRQLTEVRKLAGIAPSPAPGDALSQVAFCELEPTPDAPVKPRAAVLWDAAQHKGILRITQLPAPAEGKDYQLWAVETARKEPVNAGVVHVDAEGHAVVPFQPESIPGDNKVVALAISLEQAGGSPTNQGPILFVGKL